VPVSGALNRSCSAVNRTSKRLPTWAAAAPNSNWRTFTDLQEVTIACTGYRGDRKCFHHRQCDSRYRTSELRCREMKASIVNEQSRASCCGDDGNLTIAGPQCRRDTITGIRIEPELHFVVPPGQRETFYRTAYEFVRRRRDNSFSGPHNDDQIK